MEKLGKKIITILLSISMLMTFTPTVAFAADLGSYDAQEVTEEVTEPSADQQDDAVAEESSGDLQETEEITEPEAVPDAAAEEPTVEETPVRAAKAPTTIPDNAKFMVLISSTPKYHTSEEAGYITGTVYDTYKGEIVIHDGYVHRSNMKVQVWMQNVASLGITTARSYVRNIATGMDAQNDNPISQITGLFNSFTGATVIGHADGKTVNYAIAKNGNTITAEPDSYDNANAVWHAIVNDANVESGLDNNEDSSALITAGSYIQVEDMILVVNNNINVNNLDNMSELSAAIRGAVEYKAAGNMIDGVKVHLAQGTELNLGTTYAKVKSECMTISMPDLAVSSDMKAALSKLQLNQDTESMVGAVTEFAGAFLNKMNNSTTNVYFSFDHNYGEAKYEWSEDHSKCTATRACVDCGYVDTETVQATSSESANAFPFEGTVTTYVANFTHEGLEAQTYVAPGTYKDFKFAVSVSSKASDGSTGSVTGIVYPNYQGVLTIGEGLVNQNNMTVGVWMKDVVSLGVEGIRSYTRTLNTGMTSQDHSLNTVKNMFSKLEEATVIVKVEDGSAVTYTIVNSGNVITATPGKEDKARTVWHEIVNSDHVLAGVDDNEDSSATIKAGSYLQVEDMILLAESDVVVDNLDNMEALNAAIRNAVVYKEADKPIEGVKLFLTKDTELNMGTSFAKVAVDCMTVTADVAATQEMKDALEGLKNAANTSDMMAAAFGGMTEILEAMNETSTTVTFAFGHKMIEHEAVEPTCEGKGNTAYFECEHCGKFFSDAAGATEIAKDSWVKEASGHNWGAPTYTWAADYSTCTAERVCANDTNHKQTETVNSTKTVENKPFPYNGKVTTYTAKFTNEAFAEQSIPVPEDGKDYKFAVSVSSKATDDTVGSVTGIVYTDYQGVLTIGEGLVSQDNMTVGVWMKNVESLGVEGERSYTRTLNTGLAPQDHSLNTVAGMFEGFNEATVIAKVEDGHTVTYTITRDGRVITATPASENNARSVWHEIVNDENITATVDENEDSSALIKAGSYIQIEDMILLAEKDVVIDNLDDPAALIAGIKDAVVYKAVDTDDVIEGVKIHVAQGTKLDLGTSTAEWTRNCMSITAEVEATAEMKAALSKLQEANDVNAMMFAVYESAGTLLEAMDDTTTTVLFSFGHDLTKHEKVEATCDEAGTIEYYECENCGKLFTDATATTEITDESTLVIPATGHDWGTPVYTWSQDHTALHAKRVCNNDSSHVEEEDAHVDVNTSAQDFPYNGVVTTYTPTFTNTAFHADPYVDNKESQDFKFAVSVSSKASDDHVGTVTGIVYPNYQGVLTIGEGLVGRDNMTVGVWMKDVASLGVSGVRHYERSVATGMSGDSSLDTINNLFSNFTGATVIANVVDGHSVTYTITKDGRVITATPNSESSASTVWHEIVNETNIRTWTDDDEDSSAFIAKGSYIQVGNKILTADDDLTIDNLNDLEALNAAIRNALTYEEADEAIEGVKVYVAKGTKLDLGTSCAEWNLECMSVTADTPATDVMKNALQSFKDAANSADMLAAVYGAVTGFINAINDTTTTVTFDFGHDLTEHAATEATCEEAGNTLYYECENCGKFFSDAEGTSEIPEDSWVVEALGHDWNVTYTWAEDNAQVVAVAICRRNPAHIVVETANTTNVPTPATCTEDGKTVYTAEFQNTEVENLFETQTKEVKIDKLGHDWGEATYTWSEDNTTVTATAVCQRDSEHKAEETVTVTKTVVTAPTCLTQGVNTLTATFTVEPFVTQTKTVTVDATDHDWNEPTYTWAEDHSTCTATRTCKNDPTHIESETVRPTTDVAYDAFPLSGYTTTYTAAFTNPAFATQTDSAATGSQDYKFAVSVSSVAQDGTTGSVTGIVYPNYNGVLSINGEHVSKDNITVGVWMKNVDSLGVEGERSYIRTLSTGMEASNSSLAAVEQLLSPLHEATVIAKVEGKHSVTYTITNEERKITAIPASENNARSVWHEIVNQDNINYGTDETDDSSALIKAGSYIQVEDMILLAESDIAVDNLDDMAALNTAIRNAVVYKAADKPIEGVKVYVAQGTRLDLGTSYAEWKQNCMSITADVPATQAMKDALQGLKNAANVNDMMGAMFTGISEFCAAIDDTTTTVVFSFGHKLTKVDAVAATCEEDGNIEYYECENCGKLFSDADAATEITDTVDPKTGHDWDTPEYVWAEDNSTVTATAVCKNDPAHVVPETANATPETTDATCTEAGKTVYTATFQNTEVAGLFQTQTKEVEIPALGHAWGEVTYTWNADYTQCTAERICANDSTHKETETVRSTVVIVDPTPEEKGSKTYTAEFVNEAFETQTHVEEIPATGYTYGEPTYTWADDNSTVTATLPCNENPEKNVVETVETTMAWKDGKEANCEEGGTQIYTSASFASDKFTVQTKEVEVAALGHDLTKVDAAAATCTAAGNIEYYVCERCGKLFTDAAGTAETTAEAVVIAALGHDWNITYTWAEEKATVVAVAICKRDPAHIVVESVAPTSEITTAATCEAEGVKTFTAAFTKEPFTTQTATETIEALGHDWNEPVYDWAADHSTCSASAVCKRNADHVQTEDAVITSEVTTAATCEGEGVKTITATFTKEPFTTQTQTEAVAAAGHVWGETTYTWSEDFATCTAERVCTKDASHVESQTVTAVPTVVKDAFPYDGETTTYTATFTNEAFETQTKTVETPSRDYKFAVSVSSVVNRAEVGSVTGIVYPNYEGVISINGDAVSKDNLTVGVWMKNVDSLGVEGERHYERTINTGMAPSHSSLAVVEGLFAGLHEATVIGKVDGGHSVTYTVTNEGRKITAVPASENNARSVWHEIVNDQNIDYGTKAEDDSSAVIKAGSYIQVEDMILLAEKDVVVDNLDDMDALNAAIRDAVVYKTADKPVEGVKAFIAEGTILNLGTSYASWKQNCMSVTADVTATQAMKDALAGLKNAANVNEMMTAVFTGISEFCTAIDDTTTTVEFSFGHDLTKVDAVPHTCTEDGNIEYYICENCGKMFSDAEATTEVTDIVDPSTGHDWDEPTYAWSEDHTACTATRVCKNDASHVETGEGIVTVVTAQEDFPFNGETTTYTATFENEAFATQKYIDDKDSDDFKFAVSVSSTAQNGTTGSVTGIVYPNYQGVLSINGEYVSKDNITVGVWMKNVDSLGVDGVRSYIRTLNTGMAPSNSPLTVVETLFSGLHEATVIGRVEGGHSVTYTVTNEGRKITATPASENNARSVWHEIVNDQNIDYGTDSTDDSSAVIKAGSYIQVEDMILLAEKDVVVDNLNDMDALNAAIRDAVVYKTADKPVEGVKAYVAEGTRLDLGTSYAAWKQNCMSITADVTATQAMKDALQGLKNAQNVNEMMTAVFTGISEFCTAIDDTTTTVTFAFGHKLIAHEEVPATCDEGGNDAYYECENCGKFFEDEAATKPIEEDSWITEALGHLWGETTYMWSSDFSTCTATRVCQRDPSHVETQTVTTTSVTVDPTATTNGSTTYTADFDEPFEDQTHEVVIPATGHQWGEPTYTWSDDNGTVTATLPCTDDPTLTVTETVETTWEWAEGKEATCTEPGQKIYTAHFGNERFEDQTKTVDVPALGHDWGEPAYTWDGNACTATSICGNNAEHELTETVTATSQVTTPATCTEAGETTYTATFENELFETQTATEAIPATGHDWGTPVYTWSENLDKVVAVVICSNNPGHVIVETATVTKDVTAPGCEEAGKTVYTATFENELFETQTKTEAIPATGHDWGEPAYTWAEDNSTCTAKAVCKNDPTHILTENGKITTVDTTPATCEEDGLRTYTATFENEIFATQTTTSVIKALGHDWDTENIIFEWSEDHSSCTATFVCKRDETHRITLPCEVTSETVGNETTYTATVTFDGEEYTDVVKVDGVLRIYGKNRYKTSLKVAEYYKEIEGLEKFSTVVIATGTNFPDALTGADLAIRKHAPLIMIDGTSAAEVTAYIKANMAEGGKIYVLGGKGAVEDAWLAELSSFEITRLDGKNRYETNLSILRELEVKSGDLFVCTGMNFADALSSSAIDMPILIVGGQLTENQKTFLTEGSGWNFHLVGGAGAVSEEMEEELKAYGTVADRTGGKSRYETSTALALKFVPAATQAVLAVGDNYPDGLCGGPVANLMGAPIILSGTRGAMCGDGIKYAKAQEIYAGIVLGGPSDAMINDDTVRLTFSMEPEDEVIVYKPE